MTADETRRLEALASYRLYGTPPEADFDRCVELGARLFEVPICLVSLIGDDAQWVKAIHGPAVGSPAVAPAGSPDGRGEGACGARRSAFCAATLAAPTVVLDATLDPRFRDDPIVRGEPRVRFYAGVPLVGEAGLPIGALCVFDTKPRAAFAARERRLLAGLAAVVMGLMENRRTLWVGRAAAGFAGATAIAIVTADAQGRITFWNRAAELMFGHAAREVVGRSLDLIVPARFHDAHGNGMARLARGGAARLAGKTVEVVAVRGSGEEFPIEITIGVWTEGGEIGFGAQMQDITARRDREERLQHLARHDFLTGLMNRTGFHECLEGCLAAHARATLLAFDLDGFKAVNDGFGHPAGDALLQALAIRFASVAEDGATFARIGGDEFALILPGVADPLVAHAVAEQLLDAVRRPFPICGHVLMVGLSIGIAMAPLHAGDVDGLLLRADHALLAAKRDGGGRVRFFDTGMSNAIAARRAFKDELRQATRLGQWELLYQPQVRLDDGALIGAEALLRWHHPARGLLAPDAFLSVLESHSVAYEVGAWVVEEACRQLARWRGLGLPVPRVAINVFAAQFTAGTLEQVIGDALARHGLAPADLEIEVTETIALRPGEQTLSTLHALRRAGLHIALDDFGTGFASLTTLKQLPVTRLKIDRSFVGDLCETPHSMAIVAAIVSLADRLGFEVIAEGVETQAHRAALRDLGCNAGQGYLFGRPARADAFHAPVPLARAGGA